MSDLAGLMQARFEQLLVDFKLTFSAEQVSHPGERGRLLEEALKTFLHTALPTRIGIGSGQIVEAGRRRSSNQTDIVLYDALNYPLLLNAGSFQLFANEAVLVVIEVKSRLNSPKRLSKGLENIASSKILLKFPRKVEHPESLGIIFCYEAWKRPGTLIRNLRNAIEDNCEHLPDLICCLDPGYLLVAARLLGKS